MSTHNIPFDMRAYKIRVVSHMALHGWDTVYGGWGTVGFWSHEREGGIGVIYCATAHDPDGDRIGEVCTLGQKFRAPVNLDDMPHDILQKTCKFTKVPPL